MKQVLLACLAVLLLTACSDPKYEVQGDVVVRSHWTFSFGTCYDTLPGADPATFEQVKDWLGHDSERVYFKSTLVPGVDVATLKAERYPLFHDKKDYYYETKALHVADIASFKVIKWFDEDCWAKDSRCAYYDTVRIDGVDLSTFKVTDKWTARDKYHVYVKGLLLPEADPATFKSIAGSLYYRDKSHVWEMDRLLVGADPATFEVIKDSYYVRDKSHVWFSGPVNILLVGADPATFEVIGKSYYVRDKSHIWFQDILLEDADYDSFVAEYESFAHDKYGSFIGGQRDTDPVDAPSGEEPEPE